MIREKLMEGDLGRTLDFRWRGHEVSRIEGLSDAVFAFAITLLVVSLEVPKTFDELAETMHGFGAFLISFTLLFRLVRSIQVFPQIWLAGHYNRRAQCRAVVRSTVLCLSVEVLVRFPG